MGRSKIPAAAFEWVWYGKITMKLHAIPFKSNGGNLWSWCIDFFDVDWGSIRPDGIEEKIDAIDSINTGRNLTDTPQDALDSLSSEQMDALEKLIEWVQS
jgi:hypothetical protein